MDEMLFLHGNLYNLSCLILTYYGANILGPQFFFLFRSLGILGIGRDRSIGRYDGSTSLKVDIVLILFSEVSRYICLTLYHYIDQVKFFFNWVGVLYVAAWGRGAVKEFSCLDCLRDILGKIAARRVFRFHTPLNCCIDKVIFEDIIILC